MQTSLEAIAKKAKESKKHRFRHLYTMLNAANLNDSWRSMNRKAAPGIDKQTVADYEQDFENNISDLVARLKEKRYKAKLVRRVLIPKADGKMRPLGLPVVEDKLVQLTAARILSAIFEQDFLKSSYGYRPDLSPRDAIRDMNRELQFGRYEYIVEADIKGYFDNIDHEWLMRMLEQRIDDKAFLALIRKWLKAGILDTDGKTIHPVTGTPQGGVISPVLANIYLHYVLDIWFECVVKPRCRGKACVCRFADDFVCAFEQAEDAERFFKALPKRLEKFHLNLAVDKSRILPFSCFNVSRTSFDFLGFEFYWGKTRTGKHHLKLRTSRKKLRASKKNFTAWVRANRHKRLYDLFAGLNPKLRGYYNYYGVIGNLPSLKSFELHAKRLLFKWLNRRSQRLSYNWKTFQQMLDIHQMVKARVTEQWSSQRQSLLPA
jgi:RNA-directed DNA polymerase